VSAGWEPTLPPRDEIRSWHPEDRPASAAQQRKQALADSLRALVADVLMLDSAAIGAEGFAEAEQLLEQARAHVAGLPEIRDKGGLFGNPDDFSLFERSPFSGRCNALATPMTTTFEGQTTKAHATYGDAYEGPRGSVHGGHVIGAFDDLLGVAQAASGSPGLTGTLSVRLVARTPLHERIDYEAGVESHSGRKVVAWGRSYHGETLLAEATAIFITPRGGILAAHPKTSD
jgi:acyl-coenzyme A thioesterase PaaI-like protein